MVQIQLILTLMYSHIYEVNTAAEKTKHRHASSGRRQCLGETLAKMEYFLFSAALIQNFDVTVPEGRRLDTELDDSMGVRMPKDQPLLIQYRC